MTGEQILLAALPFIVLVAILALMLKVFKNHPERVATLRLWLVILGVFSLLILIALYITHRS